MIDSLSSRGESREKVFPSQLSSWVSRDEGWARVRAVHMNSRKDLLKPLSSFFSGSGKAEEGLSQYRTFLLPPAPTTCLELLCPVSDNQKVLKRLLCLLSILYLTSSFSFSSHHFPTTSTSRFLASYHASDFSFLIERTRKVESRWSQMLRLDHFDWFRICCRM